MKMKFRLSQTVPAILASAMLVTAVPAFAADSAKPGINMDIGIQVDGRVLVPLRDISDELGAKLSWEESTKSITLTKDSTTVQLKIGDPTVQMNGKSQTLDVPPQIKDDQTFVPVRFVAEAFGAKVKWDAEAQSTHIDTKEKDMYISARPYFELNGVPLVYDGEMKNGLPDGKGYAAKGTSIYGEKWYEGQWKDGKPVREEAPPGTEGYKIYINGSYLKSDYAPIVRNNSVYVPLWAVLGKVNASAQDVDGVIRINHPNRILLLRANSNLLTYYGDKMDSYTVRLDFPPILENNVIYVPLAFLKDYMDMKIVWGEQQRVDLTVGDLSKNNTWGQQGIISAGIKKLRLDSDAEAIWKSYPNLWVDSLPRSSNGAKNGGFERFEQLTVISYNGPTVVLSNGSKNVQFNFDSIEAIHRSFFIADPLAEFDWPESVKAVIRQQKVRIGMTQDQVLMSWGKPDDVNTTTSSFGTFEQWVYRGSSIGTGNYLYFTNGVLSSSQTLN
ncbi:MORN repeat-containing protein [Paenibacillus tianmuensis]|uniref:MORN repeat-containing protein n=1 Tax=Paenibacillus tianmuensis TaxID=624147 RepID=A0A1G4TT06_9BACL|nr:stalk domain-containing protein [Paenibacillus tianmuensis]SCW84542.1 MORN repeat-containing protein [Paenibacillus tianmuensis]